MSIPRGVKSITGSGSYYYSPQIVSYAKSIVYTITFTGGGTNTLVMDDNTQINYIIVGGGGSGSSGGSGGGGGGGAVINGSATMIGNTEYTINVGDGASSNNDVNTNGFNGNYSSINELGLSAIGGFGAQWGGI
jgi:hypothetical protein